MKTANIRLGSLDSTAPDVREFGRARDLQNVDIDKSNEVGRRNGYQRRLYSQLSGPVRMLFSFGGLCGRFFQYIDGGGLITLTGEQGSGPLRSELDSDDDFEDAGAPQNPAPGGAGDVADDDGILIFGQGVDRAQGAQEPSEDDTEEDSDETNISFSFSAEESTSGVVELTWTYAGTVDVGYVEVFRSSVGYPRPLTGGTLVTRQSTLAGTFTDEVGQDDETQYYSIRYVMLGAGIFGPGDVDGETSTTFDKSVDITQKFSDDFNRADGLLGGTWKEETNAAHDDEKYNIISNRAACIEAVGNGSEYSWAYVPRVLQPSIDISFDLHRDWVVPNHTDTTVWQFLWTVYILPETMSSWFSDYARAQVYFYHTYTGGQLVRKWRVAIDMYSGGGTDVASSYSDGLVPNDQSAKVTMDSNLLVTIAYGGKSISTTASGFSGQTNFYAVSEVHAQYSTVGSDARVSPYSSIDNFVSSGPETAWVKPSWWKD